jgi:hypothetical protein
MTDRLLPGHEKAPADPLPLGPRPGKKIHVQDHDSWDSIAKAHGVSVKELVANNCGPGATPAEINWYLHHRVGCKESKDGGRNWSFSRSADPGYIYVPDTGTVPLSVQNPKINTLYGGPKDLGCGGMEWLVEFELPKKAEGDGWIIQRIGRSYDIRLKDGKVADQKINAPKLPYWEAWPVKKGAVLTASRHNSTADGRTYDDSFDQPRRPNLKGEFRVAGLVKFYELAKLPADFIKKNPATRAMDLFSTTREPVFWDGTGTVHSLIVSWDCTDPKKGTKTSISMDVRERK